MAKKKAVAPPVVKAVPLLTGAAAHEKALKAADDAWTKAQEEASRAYDAAMSGAWTRYITALKAHQLTSGKKAKSGGTDFDKQYDKDRENALRNWNLASSAADKKLDRIKNAVGGDLTDD